MNLVREWMFMKPKVRGGGYDLTQSYNYDLVRDATFRLYNVVFISYLP